MKTNSIKTTARFAGLFYLLQIPLGVFGIMYVPGQLVDRENIPLTISNIASQESLFRLSIVSAILCALVTVATAVYIARILKPVNSRYAGWIVTFTLIAVPISFINELNHVAVLHLVQHPEKLVYSSKAEVETLVSLFLNLHEYGIKMINVFFGLWLLPMGYLVIKSKYIPKIIGWFLLVTCIGYLIDFTTFFLFPAVKITVSEYTWIGEVMMVLWLLIKGINTEAFEKQGYDKVQD
nr:DUF4386 domain-containing protein [uncultured Fluviicola sp.]